jgi:hypothetical protein
VAYPSIVAKPAKPHPDFPLFPHTTKRWAKKIKGKLHYFGPWDNPDGAIQKYLDQRGNLYAGQTLRVPNTQGPVDGSLSAILVIGFSLPRKTNGMPQMFEADDLRRIIDVADQPLKAMILPGINCGFDNNDCGTLSMSVP